MSSEQMRVTVPMAILTMIVSIIVGVFGWVINNTLNNINTNILELKTEIKNLTDVRYDHETRLQIIEEQLKTKK